MVACAHVTGRFLPFAQQNSYLAGAQTWPDYFEFGITGVVLFFAISGFVIYGTLRGPRGNAGRRFIISRFFRLFPAYWVSMAAGLATFAEVLTRENYMHVEKLSKKLVDGYRKIIAKVGLQAYIAQAGANGALMLYPQEIRNYRDWLTVDVDLWRHYWFGMVNRGVMAQPYWQDEQWTMSVQHTEADIDKHIAAFDDIAISLAKAQQERAGKTPALAAH